MRAAAFVERGLIEQLYGTGWLEGIFVHVNRGYQATYRRFNYLMVPGVLSTTGVISTPFSIAFEISKTARDMAQEMNTDASARFRPGQIRLPKPKQIVRGSC